MSKLDIVMHTIGLLALAILVGLWFIPTMINGVRMVMGVW